LHAAQVGQLFETKQISVFLGSWTICAQRKACQPRTIDLHQPRLAIVSQKSEFSPHDVVVHFLTSCEIKGSENLCFIVMHVLHAHSTVELEFV